MPESREGRAVRVPLTEIRSRLERFQRQLQVDGIGAALIVQNVGRYYLTGTMQAGFVLVPEDGAALVLVRRDPERAAAESPLPVVPLASARELAARIRDHCGEIPSPLGIEDDVLPLAQAERLRGLLPGVEMVSATAPLLRTRAIKGPYEVDLIRASAAPLAEIAALGPGLLRDGMPEIELSARLEWELRRRGHGGFTRMRGFNQEIFYGHVMAGRSAAAVSYLDAPTGGEGLGPAVPQGAGTRPIRRGEPVSVDLVGNCQGYLSDQTRTYCLGEPPPRLVEAHRAALEVMEAVLSSARPGITGGALFETALRAAAKTSFAGQFLGERHKVSFVGHGVGLEVDEPPFLARGAELPLEEGMVFALEPKMIFPAWGVVGIEDTFRVTATGVERLTAAPQVLGVVGGV